MSQFSHDALLKKLNVGGLQSDAGSGIAPVQDATAPAKPATDYTKLGQYTSNAYDPNKFNRPWDQMSEKYQIGTVLSNFDPRQGITPEVLSALNSANIRGAKFSGSGDKLHVDNAGGWERFGSGGTSDVVQGFRGGNGTWGAWAGEGGGMGPAQPAPSMSGGMPQMGGGLNSLLQGNPTAGINAAIGQLAEPSAQLRALLEALGQGQVA